MLYLLKRGNIIWSVDFILAFSLGIIFQAWFTAILIHINLSSSYLWLIITIDAIICTTGLLLFITDKRYSCQIIYSIILLLIFIIFICYTLFVYPQMFELPGLDIIRCLSKTMLLLKNKDLFYSEYPLSNFLLLFVFTITRYDYFATLMILQLLAILAPLSFYVLATVFHSQHRKHKALMSSILYMLGGGLGWIMVLKEVLSGSTFDFNLLIMARLHTALDISEAGTLFIWLWFMPTTLGFILLYSLTTFLFLLVDSEDNEYRKDIYILTFVLSLGLIFFHASEYVYWLLILISANVFFTEEYAKKMFGLNVATAISLLFAYIIYFIMPYFLTITPAIFLAFLILNIISFLINRINCIRKILELIIMRSRIAILATIVVLLIYGLGIINTNEILKIYDVMSLPIEIWCIVLGIPLILAAISPLIPWNCNKDKRKHSVIFAALLLAILLGRVLTLINVTIKSIGYTEMRIVPFAFSLVCLLAGITIEYTLEKMNHYLGTVNKRIFKKHIISKVLSVVLLMIIIFGTSLSNLLSLIYWHQMIQNEKLTNDEKQVISYLERISSDILLTESYRATAISEYTTPGVSAWLLGNLRISIMESSNPFFIADILKGFNGEEIYLLLSNDELSKLLRSRNTSYIGHLLFFYGDITIQTKHFVLSKIPKPNWIPSDNIVLLYPDNFLNSIRRKPIIVKPYNNSSNHFPNEMTIFFRGYIPPRLGNETGCYYLISKSEGHPLDKLIVYVRYEQGYLTYLGLEVGNGTSYQGWVLPSEKIPNIEDAHDYVITFSSNGSKRAVCWFVDGDLVDCSSKILDGNIYTSESPVYILKDPISSAELQIMVVYDYALSIDEVRTLGKGYLLPLRGNIMYLYVSEILKLKLLQDWLMINKIPFKLINVADIDALCNARAFLIPWDGQQYLYKLLKSCSGPKAVIFLILNSDNEYYLPEAPLFSKLNIDEEMLDLKLYFIDVNNILEKFVVANKTIRMNIASAFASNIIQILNKTLNIVNTYQTISRDKFIPFYQYSITFKEGIIEGKATIITNSCRISFPSEVTIELTDPYKRFTQKITNVSEVWIDSEEIIINSSKVIIRSSNDDISIIANFININLLGKASHLLILRNNSYVQFNNVIVSFVAPEATISTSSLKIQTYSSVASFLKAITVGDTASIIEARSWLNESLKVRGNIHMDISYGGTILITKHFSYSGSIERYSGTVLYPKYSYDEYKGLSLASLTFLYFLLLELKKSKIARYSKI